jgi:hypothetical protein
MLCIYSGSETVLIDSFYGNKGVKVPSDWTKYIFGHKDVSDLDASTRLNGCKLMVYIVFTYV